jgi:phytoene dehydrogenase-like protein
MTDYDAIVIGSGSGGTAAALALARAGKRVAIYEQHYLPGGYGQSFSLKGFRFSPGIHYIGELGPGGALRRIYEGLGVANDLVFLELDPDGYDRVFVGDDRFDIPKGLEAFRERLKQRFPSEAHGIDRYFAVIERIGNELTWARPPTDVVDAVKLPFRMRTTLRYGMEPLTRFLDRFTREPFLRAILSIQAGDHGMAPSRAPTGLHAGLQTYYMNGGCYPRGGGHVIADAFLKQLRAYGGEIHLRSEVVRILVENGRAIGVRLADGSEARADIVVANTDPGVTWGRLIEPEHVSARLRRRVERLRYSVSTISLFLAVDMDLRAAGIDSGNIWYSRTPDIDASYDFAERADISDISNVPGLFFNVTTLKDPSMRTDGLHTVEAIAIASFDAFKKWRDTKPGERGPEYARLKESLSGKILDEIERFVPGFRQHVVFSALGTPLTNTHFIHATRGGIYGTENSIRNLGPFAFPVRTQIAGLFECGASTISPGIHGVTRSGLAAAAAALRCEEGEFLTERGQTLRIYPADDPSSWPDELRPRVRRND